jgi:hypothetical protein
MTDNKKNVKKKIYWNIISLIIFIIASYCFINLWSAKKNDDTMTLVGILYLPISFFILMTWVWYISKLIHKHKT